MRLKLKSAVTTPNLVLAFLSLVVVVCALSGCQRTAAEAYISNAFLLDGCVVKEAVSPSGRNFLILHCPNQCQSQSN